MVKERHEHSLFDLEPAAKTQGPVECLGLTFENDEKRREYFLEKLREDLKDPEFRKIEGFPIGEDEDILALSDPPYYTACPNPFIEDFVKQYGKPYDQKTDDYRRGPFAADVSEGKNDPIYNAHSYHTKVPHKAIMRYILYYTEPGDVVFDGFCGTGMTGVAAQLCDDPSTLAALGYTPRADDQLFDENGQNIGSKGCRKAILNDLSPAATLIAAGYNLTRNPESFPKLAAELLKKFNREYGWMYQTTDPKSGDVCEIDFTVWSEVFSCPHCSGELEFWALAYDASSGKIVENPTCLHCSAKVSKRDLIRCTTKYYDKAVGATRSKQILKPVEICYRHRGAKKKKLPNEKDIQVLAKIEQMLEQIGYPTELMMFTPEGEEWGDLYRGYHEGISRVHDFHLVRQLVAFSILWHSADDLPSEEAKRLWRFTLQGIVVSFTRRNRFLKNAYSQVNRSLSGTLYLGSIVSEPSPTYVLTGKLKRFRKAVPSSESGTMVTTQSLAYILGPDNSVDYVFIDPPFGDNLPYAELNFLWEAWLRVFTNAAQDAVVSGTQDKDLAVYTLMMTSCLKEVYRLLKPGRWVTIEFHNSKNSVWTAIQEALGQAGFIIADVRVLDKGMLTKKQLNANAVNKDLVISAYKPNGGLAERFKLTAGTEEGVWDVVRTHLKQLPVFVSTNGMAEMIPERQSHLLFDRMVAFHVQRGTTVPLSAAEFYAGLEQRFTPRDGMYFLPDQAAEYDKKRMTVKEVLQLQLLVSDEASAIQWLKQQLTKKPQTAGDLKPQFMQEIGGWQKNEKMLELDELLEQNFLRCDGKGEVPSQIHSYLSSNFKELRNLVKDDPTLKAKAKDRWYVPDPNKAGDLEKLRERALMREFEEYRQSKQKRLKVFRVEAVRAGFKKAWQEHEYATIIAVARKIPENVLQEDPKLLMWYDQALTRTGGEV
ncbi:MAG: site-specific DNA-methyltransferase [Actinobacteria bacterium]|nr:site-specific DNA-methyltransferase [Actinomycetota bacterium]MCG2818780.1 site-specific DNA-methyltransferase [Actinomycetes bacterium]MBU4217715.1 site-specific DNA-methyltransferase [Actinomycetota bacterium]MBU4358972.1 site-specific DNA-methyltransferase [Actinomycetota bacterium]MBU4391687.1 site-specific DNA-methyltransferase [Actinomycetota bacterium]